MSALSHQLQVLRQNQNQSQRALGARLGLPQSHVSAIETGRVDPRLSSVTEMARVLDHELVLIPRVLLPAVQALISGRSDQPLWEAEEEGLLEEKGISQ